MSIPENSTIAVPTSKPVIESARPEGEQNGSTIATSRLLLVDDEASIRSSLRRLLRNERYDVFTAGSGQEAIELLEQNPVDLIISDERMPGMTGTVLLQEVRKRWPETIRVILSGYAQVNTIISAINDGAIYKFMTKPWNDEEIKLDIRRALEQHQLEKENRRMAERISEQNECLIELNAVLKQRVADASVGLNSTQGLLENICVGVLTIDQLGLVVGANRFACEALSAHDGGLIGMPARTVLPNQLSALALNETAVDANDAMCQIDLNGDTFQCRVNKWETQAGHQGIAVVLWENVV